MSNAKSFSKLYDFLSSPASPTEAAPTIVFGRNDLQVAQAAGGLILSRLSDIMIITGGVGKDTGDLLQKGFRSEAHFIDTAISEYLEHHGYRSTRPKTVLDEVASNGGENVRNSLDILSGDGLPIDRITAVAHGTSLRRLAAIIEYETSNRYGHAATTNRVPSRYPFDPHNPIDQREAIDEMMRLIEWPRKGWLMPQTELPDDLVDFSLHVSASLDNPVERAGPSG